MINDLQPILKEYRTRKIDKTRFYRKIKDIGTGITFLVLCGLSCIVMHKEFAYSSKNFPEKFEDFKGIENIEEYRLIKNDFTKGDITNIKMIDGEKYLYDTILKNSNNHEKIRIYGLWDYKIKPEGQFVPKDLEHSDMKGNTPENQGEKYWEDERTGSILLERIVN